MALGAEDLGCSPSVATICWVTLAPPGWLSRLSRFPRQGWLGRFGGFGAWRVLVPREQPGLLCAPMTLGGRLRPQEGSRLLPGAELVASAHQAPGWLRSAGGRWVGAGAPPGRRAALVTCSLFPGHLLQHTPHPRAEQPARLLLPISQEEGAAEPDHGDEEVSLRQRQRGVFPGGRRGR